MKMKFKVPTFYELVESEVKYIRNKEEKLKQLESTCDLSMRLRKEIEDSKKVLSKFKSEMRVEKLKQLGI